MKNKILAVMLLILSFSVAFAGRGRTDEVKDVDLTKRAMPEGMFQGYKSKDAEYLVGAGIYDITGPTAELEMSGYAMTEQLSEGLHNRLWARTFIIQDKAGNSIVYCINDGAWISQAMKVEICRRLVADNLKDEYGEPISLKDSKGRPLYTHENVMISATHTHAALAGNSHFSMYNFMSAGYNDQCFQANVDGIVQSIVRAHKNIQPAVIEFSKGMINKEFNVSYNRSLEPFLANPEAVRKGFPSPEEVSSWTDEQIKEFKLSEEVVDKTMYMVKFVNPEFGKPLGLLNWFAVHPTSLSNSNLYVSADNKGYASQMVEHIMGTDYTAEETFIAAFAQGAVGDSCNLAATDDSDIMLVSPESLTQITEAFKKFPEDKRHEFEYLDYVGRRIGQRAVEIFSKEGEKVSGSVAFAHSYIDMSRVFVDRRFAYKPYKYKPRTWPGATGYSMVCGAENGPSFMDGFYEGFRYGEGKEVGYVKFLRGFLSPVSNSKKVDRGYAEVLSRSDELQQEQAPKQIMFSVGETNPVWAPQVLPVQIFRIGDLALAAYPHEITTTAAARLKAMVMNTFERAGTPVEDCIIISAANSYCHYMTTPEEYELQHYEGGCTHFGVNQLSAYLQETERLVGKLSEGKTGVQPGDPMWIVSSVPDLSDHLWTFQPGVPRSLILAGAKFGELRNRGGKNRANLQDSYKAGDTLKVEFWGSHLKNDLRTMDSYFDIQRLNPETEKWYNVRTDNDGDTRFKWVKHTAELNTVIVRWDIPVEVSEGSYRIVHKGSYKNSSVSFVPFTFVSPEFTIEADDSGKITGDLEVDDEEFELELDGETMFKNVVIRFKPSAEGYVTSGKLKVGDSEIYVGSFDPNGEAKVIKFIPTTVDEISFKVLSTADGSNDFEIEEFYVY